MHVPIFLLQYIPMKLIHAYFLSCFIIFLLTSKRLLFFSLHAAANNLFWEHHTRYGNTLRFPRAAGEPPRAYFFRGLTYAYPPAGVSVYFLR
jgi:hypothetical protein